MRKITTLLLSLFMTCLVFGTSVTLDHARQVADNYYNHYSGKSDLKLIDSFSHTYNGITTFYVFNYSAGGFVLIAADDAVTPVLAQSNTGYFDNNISVPSVQYWIDNYDKDIAHIRVKAKYAKVFLVKEGGVIKSIILPMHGYGLWSTLYGFLSLDADGQTVQSINFYDQAETPGLGGAAGVSPGAAWQDGVREVGAAGGSARADRCVRAAARLLPGGAGGAG